MAEFWHDPNHSHQKYDGHVVSWPISHIHHVVFFQVSSKNVLSEVRGLAP